MSGHIGPGSNRVIVVGAINVDLVVPVARIPRAGETVVGGAVDRHGGGKGANAAVAAARAGATVSLVGAVGQDDFGVEALRSLQREGVRVEDVAVLPGATGVALVSVAPDGENQIVVAPGVNMALTGAEVRRALLEAGRHTGCVLVSTEIAGEAVVAAVETAVELGVPCVLNPAPVIPEVAGLLSKGPIVTPNAHECAALASQLRSDAMARPLAGGLPGGSDGLAEVSSELLEDALFINAHTRSSVVVTLGKHGVLMVEPDGAAEVRPSLPTVAVDTTGAGDTFNGVLGARLAAGDPLRDAVAVAVAAASLSVRQRGARRGMPTASAIREFMGSTDLARARSISKEGCDV